MDISIPFTFLSIAMVLAAFIPMLSYSYIKGMFEEIAKKRENETIDIKKKANSILHFYYAMDFVVYQSIFLILVSGGLGIIVYLSLPPSPVLSLEKARTVLIVIYGIYSFCAILLSIFLMIRYRKEWRKRWVFTGFFYALILVYIFFVYHWLKMLPNCWVNSYKCLISFTTLFLIFWACGWIIPATIYRPLEMIGRELAKKIFSQ